MNKKGFTLIEIIAVITIIAIILLIVVPNITNLLEEKKQSMYDSAVKEIEKVASQYVSLNPDIVETTLPFDIELTTLCTEELISCPIRNPLNNDNFSGHITVDDDTNGRYTYTFVAE